MQPKQKQSRREKFWLSEFLPKKPISKFSGKMSESPELISITIKWSGKEISLEDVSLTSTVADLKDLIADKTNVLPDRQKLLNLRFKGQLKGFNYVSFDAFGVSMVGLVHIEPTFIDNTLTKSFLYYHCSSRPYKRPPGPTLKPIC